MGSGPGAILRICMRGSKGERIGRSRAGGSTSPSPSRPLRRFGFRGSIAHPTRSLCTLRSRRRRRPRNTRYRAPATAYPSRSSTGRIAPASWRTRNPRKSKPIFLVFLGGIWPEARPGRSRPRGSATRTLGARPAREQWFRNAIASPHQNRTVSPVDGAVSSPSHIARRPRTIVPTGQPVTVLPS